MYDDRQYGLEQGTSTILLPMANLNFLTINVVTLPSPELNNPPTHHIYLHVRVLDAHRMNIHNPTCLYVEHL